MQHLSVREISLGDVGLITDYWMQSTPEHLISMGVDLDKMPAAEDFTKMLAEQIEAPLRHKRSYCIIWLADGRPIGHCNINSIVFGKEAHMHLHVWNDSVRRRGYGAELVKMTLPYFFKNYELEVLYCEPYALNRAPNRTLEKAGFTFVKEYMTMPGSFSFEQSTNLWQMTREAYEKLSS